MALSNWDTLTFGPNGKPSNGSYKSPITGIIASIYKNWLDVRENGLTRLSINSGDLYYSDFSIDADRYKKQNAIFVFIKCSYENKKGKLVTQYFGGVGCYAYIGNAEYLRRNDPEFLAKALKKAGAEWFDPDVHEAMDYWSSNGIDDAPESGFEIWKDDSLVRVPLGDVDYDTFVGVEASTYQAWLEWVESKINEYDKDAKKWLTKVKQATPIRFNQGDAFFGAKAGTPIGEANEPLLTQMLK